MGLFDIFIIEYICCLKSKVFAFRLFLESGNYYIFSVSLIEGTDVTQVQRYLIIPELECQYPMYLTLNCHRQLNKVFDRFNRCRLFAAYNWFGADLEVQQILDLFEGCMKSILT